MKALANGVASQIFLYRACGFVGCTDKNKEYLIAILVATL